MRRIDPLFSSGRFVGFDMLSDLADRLAAESTKTYPPYNLIRLDEGRYRIELAVAGFAQDDLSVEREGDVLRISGTPAANEVEGTYAHRGIAMRSFSREFHLAPHIVVGGAQIVNGLLAIDLARETPEALRPQKIAIQDAAPTALAAQSKNPEGEMPQDQEGENGEERD